MNIQNNVYRKITAWHVIRYHYKLVLIHASFLLLLVWLFSLAAGFHLNRYILGAVVVVDFLFIWYSEAIGAPLEHDGR